MRLSSTLLQGEESARDNIWRCDSRQLKTVADILKSEHIQSNRSVRTVTPDATDRTVFSRLVWRCELSRPDKCVQRRSVSGGAGTVGATAGRTPTQNALVWRSGRLNSHRHARLDNTSGRGAQPFPPPPPTKFICTLDTLWSIDCQKT